MVRLNGDRAETITSEEVEALCRDLRTAAEALNAVRDGAEKLVACMVVFGRAAVEALEAARLLENGPPSARGSAGGSESR